MNRKFFIATLFVIAIIAMAVPSMDLAGAWAQLPPPELPGAPDQSPLWGAGLAAAAAVVFGIWRLAKRNH